MHLCLYLCATRHLHHQLVGEVFKSFKDAGNSDSLKRHKKHIWPFTVLLKHPCLQHPHIVTTKRSAHAAKHSQRGPKRKHTGTHSGKCNEVSRNGDDNKNIQAEVKVQETANSKGWNSTADAC